MRLRRRIWEVVTVLALVVVAVVANDRLQESRRTRLREELKKEFVAEMNAAVQTAVRLEAERAAKANESLPPVKLAVHKDRTPKGDGQVEIFNLSSTPAYADASGTRVTGEIHNGTGRPFTLLAVALVALDGRGKVLHRQPILLSTVAAGDRRAFETTINVPMNAFAAHRFELDMVR